jgi:hypothetical protein
MAPARAANSCWFGAAATPPSALPDCSDPSFSFDLFGHFNLLFSTLPTVGSGTIGFHIKERPTEFPDDFLQVDVNFLPTLQVQGSTPPISGQFNYQLSIAPFDTDYLFYANLKISPPASAPASLTVEQQNPETNQTLNASLTPEIGLFRYPDPLKSITLLGNFTLNSGTLNSIHNGFGIFYIDPPEVTAAPAPLPLWGAALAFGFSRRLRRRRFGGAPVLAGPKLSAFVATRH